MRLLNNSYCAAAAHSCCRCLCPLPLPMPVPAAFFLCVCFCLPSCCCHASAKTDVGLLITEGWCIVEEGEGGLVCTVEWDDSAANKLCAIESIKVSVNCKRRFITTTNCKNTRKNNKQNFAPPLFYLHTYICMYIHICCMAACVCVCLPFLMLRLKFYDGNRTVGPPFGSKRRQQRQWQQQQRLYFFAVYMCVCEGVSWVERAPQQQ